MPHQLDNLDGLVIPGGESATLRKLAESYNLMDPLRRFAVARPTWGTCAGAILLAREIVDQVSHLAVMDIKVKRNAFGRQINSFVADVDVEGESYSAVFIRDR